VPPLEPPAWLTLDAVAHYPRPGTVLPANVAFSPDSNLLTYLFSERGDLVRELWTLDLQSGERRILAQAPDGGTTDANVNPEEALRRERQRLREGGITHYSWAKAADRILVPLNGQLFVTTSAGGALQPLAPSDDPAIDAQLTPDGSKVVYARERELWTVDIEKGESCQLTFDTSEAVSNGLAEFIAQEEMGRSSGFWISPGGDRVVYEQFDEGHIPRYPIVHQGEPHWRVEEHRYPFAGGDNVRVRLGVVGLLGGDTRWLDLGDDADIYLARVDWCPDGSLWVQIEARDQRRLELWRYDVSSGQRVLVLAEESRVWINLHSDLRFRHDGSAFIWSSERSGYRHLELRSADGRLVRQLTSGSWPVDRVIDVDEERRVVYFLAGRDTPIERHLFRVSFDGGEPERMTAEPGTHTAVFSPDHRLYVLSSDSCRQPPSMAVRSITGEIEAELQRAEPAVTLTPGISPPEIIELRSPDGDRLFGAVYRPPESGEVRKPLIVSVYGGPHAQMVSDSWGMTVDLRAQYLAAHGFVVFKLDNRGSARRGLAFEGAIQRRLGSIEVQDQVAGVRWLVEQGIVDGGRVGIYGWSYGGYLAAMCLLTAPDVFKAAVAGAPVTDWDGYDTHYTERYMDQPSANADGYRAASVLSHVDRLAGHLLLIHGMVDENVHFRHTARLVTSLQNATQVYDILVYPEERHMPRSEEGRRHMEARIVEYLQQALTRAD
jgi:dipeptidyl-peptidase-4